MTRCLGFQSSQVTQLYSFFKYFLLFIESRVEKTLRSGPKRGGEKKFIVNNELLLGDRDVGVCQSKFSPDTKMGIGLENGEKAAKLNRSL